MEVSVEKPGSPADILKHFGKKGMKWGVRNAAPSMAGMSKKKKTLAVATGYNPRLSRQIQKENAARSTGQVRRDFRRDFPTGKAKAQEIHRARVQEQAMRAKAIAETNPAKREKLVQQWRDSPDRAIAERTTRGEKAVLSVLAVALAAPTAGASVAALAGYTGTGLAIRKGIERGQARRAQG